MSEPRVVHHHPVVAAPGQPGAPSTPMGGDFSKMPAAIRSALTGIGKTFVFACNPRLASGPQHLMTSIPGMVNCVRCRKTKAWLDAPDEWLDYPKTPGAKVADAAAEYLEEPAVVSEPALAAVSAAT